MSPIVPKLPTQLDSWQGMVEAELELEHCTVDGGDFSSVRKLELEGCIITSALLTGMSLDKLRCNDTVLARIEAAGLNAPEGVLLRTVIRNSRMTGADFGAALLEDCTFEAVKLDEAGLRFATLKRVVFKGCVLRDVDFTGAKLLHVNFSECDLEGANFDHAACTLVDIRGEKLVAIKGVNGLRGARISSEQLIELAPLLALELGLDVDYET